MAQGYTSDGAERGIISRLGARATPAERSLAEADSADATRLLRAAAADAVASLAPLTPRGDLPVARMAFVWARLLMENADANGPGAQEQLLCGAARRAAIGLLKQHPQLAKEALDTAYGIDPPLPLGPIFVSACRRASCACCLVVPTPPALAGLSLTFSLSPPFPAGKSPTAAAAAVSALSYVYGRCNPLQLHEGVALVLHKLLDPDEEVQEALFTDVVVPVHFGGIPRIWNQILRVSVIFAQCEPESFQPHPRVVLPRAQVRRCAAAILESLPSPTRADAGASSPFAAAATQATRGGWLNSSRDACQRSVVSLSARLVRSCASAATAAGGPADGPSTTAGVAEALCEEVLSRCIRTGALGKGSAASSGQSMGFPIGPSSRSRLELDSAELSVRRGVLAALAAWVETLQVARMEPAAAERILGLLKETTALHYDLLQGEVEGLWQALASRARNAAPAMAFLVHAAAAEVAQLGGSAASLAGSGSGAWRSGSAGGPGAAKVVPYQRAALHIARVAPQQAVDQLVFEMSRQRRVQWTRAAWTLFLFASVAHFLGGRSACIGSTGMNNTTSLTPRLDSLPYSRRYALSREGGLIDGSTAAAMSACFPDSPLHQSVGSGGDASSATPPLPPPTSRRSLLGRAPACAVDVASILLAEVATEHPEDVRPHLAPLMHGAVLALGGSAEGSADIGGAAGLPFAPQQLMATLLGAHSRRLLSDAEPRERATLSAALASCERLSAAGEALWTSDDARTALADAILAALPLQVRSAP